MRYAIISDIHSNLAAFQAVLNDINKTGGIERIWCLGDIVGYGPDPKECIELLRQYEHVCVAGNHDWGALEKIDLNDFNPEAAAACRWTGQQLGPDEIDYLANLPLTLHEGDFTLAHGSPREPIWEYLLSTYSARISFDYFQTKYCLVGHSHVPAVFEQLADSEDCFLAELSPDAPLILGENRQIINPGGVGQPRDGDPRAAYAIYDSEHGVIQHHRVPYDIDATQQKMAEYGLPSRLITRLSYGW
jgi:diadenosine tetraphosphatase ApaH/serine/threonine PP2A family protein phosphatase